MDTAILLLPTPGRFAHIEHESHKKRITVEQCGSSIDQGDNSVDVKAVFICFNGYR